MHYDGYTLDNNLNYDASIAQIAQDQPGTTPPVTPMHALTLESQPLAEDGLHDHSFDIGKAIRSSFSWLKTVFLGNHPTRFIQR
jgi:hypothetical protein